MATNPRREWKPLCDSCQAKCNSYWGIELTEGPIRIGSFLTYQIIIFILVIIWAFMGFTMAQFQLLPLYETPHTWIAWAAFILASIIPVITPVTWRMKTQIIYVEPEWDFRKREVSQSEYSEIMKQYRNEYRDYLSIIDYRLLLLAIIISVAAIATPFLWTNLPKNKK